MKRGIKLTVRKNSTSQKFFDKMINNIMKAYGRVVKLVITFPLFDTLLGLTVTHAKHC